MMAASVLEGSPLSSAKGSTHTFVQGSLPLNLHTCPAGHRVHPDQFWPPHWEYAVHVPRLSEVDVVLMVVVVDVEVVVVEPVVLSTHTFVQGSLPFGLHTWSPGHEVHPDQF